MKRFVVGNWKMSLLASESVALVTALMSHFPKLNRSELWIAPSFLALPVVASLAASSHIKVGSQTLHGENLGAFTGEVSAEMLKECGGTFAIIGHSERRWMMGETDTFVSQKAAQILRKGITPIFCIGESLEEREAGETQSVLQKQLSVLFSHLLQDEISAVIIAYEPRWAIGTGKVATPSIIKKVHTSIHNFTFSVQSKAPRAILYGGSVTPTNFAEILSIPHVHGGLVGGASLNFESFAGLVKIAEDKQ